MVCRNWLLAITAVNVMQMTSFWMLISLIDLVNAHPTVMLFSEAFVVEISTSSQMKGTTDGLVDYHAPSGFTTPGEMIAQA